MTTILLLGGTGFLGVAAAVRLGGVGHEVVTLGRGPSADIKVDAMDPESLLNRLVGVNADVVVNLLGAGLTPGSATEQVMQSINADLPAAVYSTLSAIRRHRPAHVVHVASSTERQLSDGSFESTYARTKHDGTSALLTAAASNDLPVTILTLHNTYGAGQPVQRFVAGTIERLRRGEAVEITYPHRVRDFVHVDDVAACIAHAVHQPAVGVCEAEIGTGTGTTLLDCAAIVAHVLGRPTSLLRAAPDAPPDVSPTTVCSVPQGTFGLCTTELSDGIRRAVGVI